MNNYSLTLAFLLIFVAFSCSPQSEKNQTTEFDYNMTRLTEQEKEKGILTPEILWKFGRVSDHQLSPDGDQIIYNVTRYNSETNKSVTDIYLTSSEGGEQTLLTGSMATCFNPRWKPDGSGIGFVSVESGEAQIWEMNPDGSAKKQVSFISEGINGFEYSPDGNNIFYLKDVKLDEAPADVHKDLPLAEVKIVNDLMYRHWNQWHDYKYSHIFIAEAGNAISGGMDIMADEKWDAPLSPYFDQAEICWSPDGKYIAYTCKKMKGVDYAVSTNSDIYLYSLEDGTTENLTQGMQGYDKYPAFSNDGTKIAWQSMETPGYEADKNRLFVMDLVSRKKKYLTKDFDQDAEHLVWNSDDSRIFFISGIEATYQLYSIEIENQTVTQITKGDHNYNSFQIGEDFLTAEKMSMSMATELFRVDPVSGEEAPLTKVNSEIYNSVEMGRVEERWVTTTDNKQMKVWVIYPPNFDPQKKYPALLYCQGGPQSAVSQFFSYRWNFQIMAANDYIIVAPNRRGLPSFGSEWNKQISGDYGGQNIKDYLSAIDELKKEDFIDENRLGAIGASYGGFSVFYLAGHHQGRFKAFISHCGIFNFESMYGATEELFFVNHDIGGPYWEKNKPESYKFSPHRFVDKWDTPIMIVSGENDFRIPYTESLQAFNAAKLKGLDAKLLIYPEETHFVLKPQNAILWQREFFGWLDKYLK